MGGVFVGEVGSSKRTHNKLNNGVPFHRGHYTPDVNAHRVNLDLWQLERLGGKEP